MFQLSWQTTLGSELSREVGRRLVPPPPHPHAPGKG